jgi:ankyrin repeat protein
MKQLIFIIGIMLVTATSNMAQNQLANELIGQDIHVAVQKGNLSLVKAALEEYPGQIETLNASQSTPLIVAASFGYIQVVSLLLDKGADIQVVNKWGRTALHYAVEGAHLETAKLLLKKGINVDGHKDFLYTPLHLASDQGLEKMVNLLLSEGANVNIQSSSGYPLHRAANGGNTNIILMLLKGGADINAVTSRGWTPLHQAASSGRYEAAKVLIENGINLNTMDKWGATALHWAVRSGDREAEKVALLLLKYGVETNTFAIDGSTPLLTAVKQGKDKAVKLLLEKGADNSVKDGTTQRTMLHFAGIHGYGEIASSLIKSKIDIHAQDLFGRTALDYAEIHGNRTTADFIYAAGGKSGDNEKNFGHSSYLEAPLSQGEAYIWKLASFGWVVKTRNHLFVFNHEEHSKRPDEPLLANGFISASELADQNIFAVYPAYHAETYAKEGIHAIEDSLKNIIYIHFKGDKFQGNRNTIHLGGQGNITIQNVSFTYADEKDEDARWLNYFIGADEFNFYYSGPLGAPLDVNKKHLEYMAKGVQTCNAAFILLSRSGRNSDYIDQVISILKPKEVFLHMVFDIPSEEMIEEIQKKYPAVRVNWARNPGQRFQFK